MIPVPKAESLKDLFSLKGKVVIVTGASGASTSRFSRGSIELRG